MENFQPAQITVTKAQTLDCVALAFHWGSTPRLGELLVVERQCSSFGTIPSLCSQEWGGLAGFGIC